MLILARISFLNNRVLILCMTPEIIQMRGNVAMTIGAVAIGVTTLFIGLFMLSSIDPMFAGRVTECTYVNTAPSAGAALNATQTSGSTSANLTFASATNQQGYLTLVVNVSNTSATTGSYLEVRNTAGTLLNNHTVPAAAQQFTSSTTISHSSGNYVVNVTAFGGNNLTVPTTGTYLRRCSALVAQAGPAGQHYNSVVALIATAFSVFGLVLIVIGLAYAVGSLKSMM